MIAASSSTVPSAVSTAPRPGVEVRRVLEDLDGGLHGVDRSPAPLEHGAAGLAAPRAARRGPRRRCRGATRPAPPCTRITGFMSLSLAGAPRTALSSGAMDERVLAEKLIAADTSHARRSAQRGRLRQGLARGARHRRSRRSTSRGCPCCWPSVGPPAGTAPTVILHGHLDVVPAHPEQFEPRIEGDRLIGRGAYDMKGALACADVRACDDVAEQDRVRVEFICVPDEESEDVENHSIDWIMRERKPKADFAITGEPTDLHIGVQAKGVLAVRVQVGGTAAHGSTPWLGDNAILKAHDVFRRIETMPFSRESSDLFDRPSINLARINGGDAFNKVPDRCEMDVDIRYLPGQDPGAILAQIRALPDTEIVRASTWPPAVVDAHEPVRRRAARGDRRPDARARR